MYDQVYDRFLNKITDYELAEAMESDIEKALLKYLRSSITDFKYSKKDLGDRDDDRRTFHITLTEFEQEILSKFMLVHWITPQILRLENIRQNVSNKDFQFSSGANFLDKLIALKKELRNEAFQELIYYHYDS